MIRLLALLCLWPAVACAQDPVTARFDVLFGPLRVATITLHATETDTAYAAAGRVESAGLAGVFRDIRFDLAAEGRREGNAFLPLAYREDVETGRRTSRVALDYSGGRPIVVSPTPAGTPAPWQVAPADQLGTVDPMSALYRLARPRPFDALCDWSVAVFDGQRRSALTLAPAEIDGARANCTGEYRRIAGFPPDAMAERHRFPFVAEYDLQPGGAWRLTRVETQTLYGRVRIIARF